VSALRLALVFCLSLTAVHAAVPDPLDELDDVESSPSLDELDRTWVHLEPAPVPPSEMDVDELLEPAPEVSLPELPRWQLATRDALTFDTWPPDLDQGRVQHRQAMDLVDRGVIPLFSGWFCPDAGVTRAELLAWLAHVEDWVQIAKSGLSLDVRVSRVRAPCPVRLVLRLGLAAPDRPLDGNRRVDRAFLLRVLDGLERSWGANLLAHGPRLTVDDRPDRVQVAVWLRDLAQDLCRVGRVPTMPLDPRSLAHLPVILALLSDPSPQVRQAAHRIVADFDPAVLAMLIAARGDAWYREPAVLASLPETAVKLGAAIPAARSSTQEIAREFALAMRILRGLNSSAADVRFVRLVQQELARTPLDAPLPQVLIDEAVSVLVARRDVASLNQLLHWGLPVVQALVPHLEQSSLDRHWAERMPYALEPGWDERGRGVAQQLKLLARNPRIPAPTRASALERLARLGETLSREQARAAGLLGEDDGSRERLERSVARVVEPAVPMRIARHISRTTSDDEVARLHQTVRVYQLYLALALGVLALLAAIHLAVLVPMLGWRLLNRVRRWANPPAGKVLPDDPPLA
jgi:hypothetical protein